MKTTEQIAQEAYDKNYSPSSEKGIGFSTGWAWLSQSDKQIMTKFTQEAINLHEASKPKGEVTWKQLVTKKDIWQHADIFGESNMEIPMSWVGTTVHRTDNPRRLVTVSKVDGGWNNTLIGAAKWLERISDRMFELPSSFHEGEDPSPIAKELRAIAANFPPPAPEPVADECLEAFKEANPEVSFWEGGHHLAGLPKEETSKAAYTGWCQCWKRNAALATKEKV